MSTNLYPIQQDHLSLLRIIEDADGEVTEEIENALQLTKEKFQEQALSIGYVFKHLGDRTDIIKKEIDRLKSLQERTTKAQETVKQSLAATMQLFDISEIKGDTLKLSFRKSESVEVDNDLLPTHYKTQKITYTPDKEMIKDDIKNGVHVVGARLVEKQNLQIK